MNFVLDNSVIMAWLFEDERDDYSLKVLDALSFAKVYVPAIWPLEYLNTLLVAERKKRISFQRSQEFRSIISLGDFKIDKESVMTLSNDLYSLAKIYKLTVYDASYLELALRRSLPLVSLDKQVIRASKKAGLVQLDF